jgi:hypothetical protein
MESINITSMERVFHEILADMTLPPRTKKGMNQKVWKKTSVHISFEEVSYPYRNMV